MNQTQPLTFPATRQTRARRCLATLATALAVPLAAGPAVAPATRAALRATGAATTAVKWSAGAEGGATRAVKRTNEAALTCGSYQCAWPVRELCSSRELDGPA